jgi:hypothetical protein
VHSPFNARLDDLLADQHAWANGYGNGNNDDEDEENSIPNTEEEKKSFNQQMRKEAELKLYPGCSLFTRFSFLVTILHWKSKHLITNSAFANIFQILREAFSPANTLPRTYREAEAVIDKLGLG